jgi:hypothetical protein
MSSRAVRRPQGGRVHRRFESKLERACNQAGYGKPACCHSGPSRTRTWSQWIKNENQPSASVTNREITRDEQCPIATDQTGDAVSKPFRALSRSTLIASLCEHAGALAQAGDIAAARVAHEAAGKLLQMPEHAVAVVDLNERRKP